jgi:hypothetical protein
MAFWLTFGFKDRYRDENRRMGDIYLHIYIGIDGRLMWPFPSQRLGNLATERDRRFWISAPPSRLPNEWLADCRRANILQHVR